VVYELPFGKGKRYASRGSLLGYVMGGWQANAIVSLHSGTPYTLGVSGDIANTGNSNNAGYYERLNLIGDPHLDDPATAQWFNTKAFAIPANFTYGNLGRNALRTYWPRNLDISLFRDFPLGEGVRLQFRAEAFNVTNSPVWGTPVSNLSNANFGRVLSVANSPRQLQLALKLRF
jgi:hypothetical protein